MGVPGLWDVLRPTGQVRALAHLATEDGFVANTHGYRAFRVGIDASIWFFHALSGREGENPELRTLFFRCARLLAMPFLPIFVFDGPERPKIKRGRVIGRQEHWMVNSLRSVLNAFGFECRTAPGEAEAELAFLNRIGVIDAVLSDDVDCFIFGAQTVMRNGSLTLSGNRAHATGDAQHVYIYRAQDIVAHPDVRLSQGGLILIALLRGGDYDEGGISGCGVSTAHALARVGFGDTLLAAARAGPAALNALLPSWRADLREELRTNASELLQRKCPSVAQRITEDFPSLEVLRCYTHPLTSERAGGDLAAHGLGELWKHTADVGKIAHVCERFFEWGFEEAVVKRFRTVIWPGAVLRTLLQAALERDRRADDTSNHIGGDAGTPSKVLARSLGTMTFSESRESYEVDSSSDTNKIEAASLIKTIHGTRHHPSTDGMLEYRIEVHPGALVARTRAGMRGLRVVNRDSAKDPGADDEDDEDEDEDRKTRTQAPDPDSALRVWMPASVVEYACPHLVKAFEAKKAAKKNAKGTGKGRRMKPGEETENDNSPLKAKRPTKAKAKPDTLREEGENDPSGPKKTSTKPAARKEKTKEGRADESAAGNLPVHKTKKSFLKASVGSDGSSSLVEMLNENLFPVLAEPSSSPSMARGGPPKFRPFPMSLETDHDVDPFSITSSTYPRKHSVSASRPSSDLETTPQSNKSPRTSAAHTSPRKSAARRSSPERPTSPSPMRPFQRASMGRPSESSEVIIIISSDSDSPPVPSKARLKPQRSKPKHRDALNLHCDTEVIDLT